MFKLSRKQKKAIIALAIVTAFLIIPHSGPAATGSFFNDILSDVGVSKTLSTSTSLLIFALAGVAVIFWFYKPEKE